MASIDHRVYGTQSSKSIGEVARHDHRVQSPLESSQSSESIGEVAGHDQHEQA